MRIQSVTLHTDDYYMYSYRINYFRMILYAHTGFGMMYGTCARNLLQPNLELVISQFYAAGLEVWLQ